MDQEFKQLIQAIHKLGTNHATQFDANGNVISESRLEVGAVEFLAIKVEEGLAKIATAIDHLTDAVLVKP
jgi:YD repeat-containing protein